MMKPYNDKSPLNISEEDLKKADSLLSDITGALSFFKTRLHDRPNMTDVWTGMGLFESYLTELGQLTDYESVLQTEREKRSESLREANNKICELNKLIGCGISAESVKAKLKDYEDALRLWYAANGFRYAGISYTGYGITLDFSSELELYREDRVFDGHSGRKEWTEAFAEKHENITKEGSGFDIAYDVYHGELLDTDNNKRRMGSLFAKSFPGYRVHSYKSRENDYGSLSLRMEVHIPYGDIEALIRGLVPGYDKSKEIKEAYFFIPERTMKYVDGQLNENSSEGITKICREYKKHDLVESWTAKFDGGIEMDIKLCCGDTDDSQNPLWAEAVLFDDGCEVACSEPEDKLHREWELEYKGVTYRAVRKE